MKAVIDDQIELVAYQASQGRERCRISLVHKERCNPVFLEQDLPVDVGTVDLRLRQKISERPQRAAWPPLLPIFETSCGLFVPSPISSRAVTDAGSDNSEP